MFDALEFILPFLFLVGFVGVIGAVVYFILRLRAGEQIGLSFSVLLKAYLYIASLISLLFMVGGIASLANYGLSRIVGDEFSYYPEFVGEAFPLREAPDKVVEPPPAEEEQQKNEEEQQKNTEEGLELAARRDLVTGLVTTFVAGLLFAAHWAGRRASESNEERRHGLINRVYTFLLLVIFGIGTIISLPQALVESINYSLDSAGTYRSPPGEELSAALIFLPVWLYYLFAVLRQVRSEKDSTEPKSL